MKSQKLAIGETGLDFYHSTDLVAKQKDVLLAINLAKQVKKPLIIHTRSARQDTINLMSMEKAQDIGSVLPVLQKQKRWLKLLLI